MNDFDIVYACGLALTGALVLWVLPRAVWAVLKPAAAWARKRPGPRAGAERQTTFQPVPPRVRGMQYVGR